MAFRLAIALGVVHPNRLFETAGGDPASAVLTWDEFTDWLAYYQVEPWGDERADLRQAVAIAYQNIAWLPDDAELPEIVWPYFPDAEEIDFQAVREAIEEHATKWADWERERRLKAAD